MMFTNKLFNIIRHLMSHFPQIEKWDDILIKKDKINWNTESKTIDKFFEEYQGTVQILESTEFKYEIKIPSGYSENNSIYLKDIVDINMIPIIIKTMEKMLGLHQTKIWI